MPRISPLFSCDRGTWGLIRVVAGLSIGCRSYDRLLLDLSVFFWHPVVSLSHKWSVSLLSFSMLDRITKLDQLELAGVEVKRTEVSRTVSRHLSLHEDFIVNWCSWEHKSLAP